MSMPRNVRNFWVEVEIDGRKTKFAGGPRSKDGGLRVTIKQRHRGKVVKALEVEGEASGDDLLLSSCVNGELIPTVYETKR
jgi:hypothetical protein